VELTDEREQHIAEEHPDLLPEQRDRIAETLIDPDQVGYSVRGNTRLLSKYYDSSYKRKCVVVVVICDTEPSERNWIVTAYRARSLPPGEVEWTKS